MHNANSFFLVGHDHLTSDSSEKKQVKGTITQIYNCCKAIKLNLGPRQLTRLMQ